MQYWLLKSEPNNYSIDDLKRDKIAAWSGVRNYQARNFMTQSMSVGDFGLFYHSNAEPSGVTGICKIHSKAHTDLTAFDRKSQYFEPRATKEKPVWACVDVKFEEKFSRLISLAEIRSNRALAKMELLKKGSRLSIQPVTETEFNEILKMTRSEFDLPLSNL